ncbi:MAG: discoidin domain-containing protein, partial [Planctomycetales bacterium]|nr:discoidin domain-containing protein [Planctomycetales bacterium]
VLVAMAPDILFLKDTDGDDVADVREAILHGIDSADTHHTANSFTLDPGGAMYFQEGTFHHTQVETPYGPVERVANGAVFRYDPRRMKFEVYVSHGFANPHGHVFGPWSQETVHDGTGAVPYDGALFSGRVEFPMKHNRPPTVYQQRTRPCPATELLSSRHFPDEMQGNLLVANVIGFQGILRYKLGENGGSHTAEELDPIVFSEDANFRPVDVEMGPDGAIYFTDWQNPIIGHMQHNLRDPSRDRVHGRVYRVTYKGRQLSKPPQIAGAPLDQLLDVLKSPVDRERYWAKLELSGRDTDEVIAAVERWTKRLDWNDPNYEHHLMEALWVHQHHNVVNTTLLEQMLKSPEPHARAATARVLCYWRDDVSNSLELFRQLAADEHPRVRLEAVRAASFYKVPEAIEIPIIAAEQPSDPYVDFVRAETMRTIEGYFQAALARGDEIAFATDAGARFLLKNISTDKLLEMERGRAVFLELLYRAGVRDEYRREALAGLAKLENKSEMQILLDAIHTIDARQQSQDESVVFDLVRLLSMRSANELTQARAELEKLATGADQPVIRQISFVALMSVDNSPEPAWQLATQSVHSLRDLVNSMPLIPDGSLRAALYPRVEPLLNKLPENLAAKAGSAQGDYGRYVRIEIPGRATLTLAEVEVYSDGRNVARRGKATQSSTAHGGDASRAIDGNKSGSYGDGGQTHTPEDNPDPWWELDLGEALPIDKIAIYNRTEGDLGNRLNNFTIKVLDESRNVVFSQEKNPTPKPSVEFALEGGGPAGLVRRAAMNALTSVRGQETQTFERLSSFVTEGTDALAAIRALRRIPRQAWPAEQARPLLDASMALVRKIPTAERTSPAALDVLEFSESLATLLPAEEAKQARAELRELGVRVIRVGTLLERMSYDKETIVVAAGKPVEFLFENSDLMPHNFVILQPGALEEVGLLAEATAQDPKSAERQYVPPSNRILLASRLLQPRDSQKLSFTAPNQPGVYPYVCTYPGHWRRMYGALYVVEDLDGYLADPEGYLAAANLPVRDDLLKDRRPRTEWNFDDLAASLDSLMELGRSYGNGKQMFTVANCVACHKLNDAGQSIGPDLAKLDDKFKPVDILREMLDPSARINEKFQTYVFLTDEGKVITGLILEETPDTVKVIENPLAKTQPIVLKKSEIDSRQKSPVSIMPKGLLDKLTREEIMDLLAYVVARGQAKHAIYQGHHDHGHNH